MLWRLARVARYEQHAITATQDTVEADYAERRRMERLINPSYAANPYAAYAWPEATYGARQRMPVRWPIVRPVPTPWTPPTRWIGNRLTPWYALWITRRQSRTA